MTERILIAAPIAGHKQETLGLWLEWCARQSVPDVDVMLVPNGRYAGILHAKLLSTTFEKGSNAKRLTTRPLPYVEKRTVYDWISIARERIRDHAIEEDYDWLFWLDTDTIPVSTDALKELLRVAHERKLASVCGLYLYKGTRQPVYTAAWGINPTFEDCVRAAENAWLLPVTGGGLGCCLQHKSAFQATAFLLADMKRDPHGRHTTSTEDYPYLEALEWRGIPTWLWPRVTCHHLGAHSLRAPSKAGSGISLYTATPYTGEVTHEEAQKSGEKQEGTPGTRQDDSQGHADAHVHDDRRDDSDTDAARHDQQLDFGEQGHQPAHSIDGTGDVQRQTTGLDDNGRPAHEAKRDGDDP